MAVKLRLTRQGGKKRPFYRIVAADSSAERRQFHEVVGTYDPMINPAKVDLKSERVSFWLEKGVIPTETVRQILKKAQKAA